MLQALMEVPAFWRAMVAGVLGGALASFYGAFIVQRKLGFLGNGLAHAAFGGVALGLLIDVEPFLVAIPFTVAVALAIVYSREKSRIASDTVIGVFFSVSMALGVLFLSMRKNYSGGDAMNYLFGSILTVSARDLQATVALFALAVALCPMWGRWAYASFDRELAEADRVDVVRDDYVLFAALAATIVAMAKIAGLALVAAFLVIPAATARLLARTFLGMTLLSVLLGASSAAGGLWLAYERDIPSGAAIILVQAALFFLAIPIGKARGSL